MNKDLSDLFIWDYPNTENIKIDNDKLILWRGFSSDNNIISIPQLTEKWSDSIRNEYLDWIYRLGKFNIKETNIIEALKIRDSFSAWWFGLLVEKSNLGKSIYINDIIRLFTFKKLINNKPISKITLCTSNENLIKTLKIFCSNNKIKFVLKRSKNQIKFNITLKKIFFSLPHFLRALIWFFYRIIYFLPLIIKSSKEWGEKEKKFIFVSYLFNMRNSDINNFSFSNYWGELPKKLKENKTYTYWLHLYVKDKFLNSPYKASKLIDKLNKNNKLQKHITLFSFINIKVICKVLIDWIKLYKKNRKIEIHKNFPIYKGLELWPFYKNDWYDSFIGINSIDNLMYLNLFQKAFKFCKKSSVVSYLLENQGWEISMLSVCRALDIKKTIGFYHTASRYWDLRNFCDKREFSNNKNLRLPRPKIMALNSIFDFDQFIEFGYPKNQLRLVEALRYSYLKKNLVLKINKYKNKKSLLVLGSHDNSNTKDQLSILSKVPKNILEHLEIIYKPHPASSLDINIFHSLKMKKREESISELLPHSNLVYCSSVSSASVDAFSFGSEVIIYNDPNFLNLSPLRKFDEVNFVMDSDQLEMLIVKFFSRNIYTASQRVIFELNEELPLWKNLLFETI